MSVLSEKSYEFDKDWKNAIEMIGQIQFFVENKLILGISSI